MQFKEFAQGPSEGGATGMFLRFAPGETKRLVLAGEISECYKKWVGGKGIECAPDDPEAGLRFKVNAIVDEDGALVAKVWEFGITIYRDLAAVHSEYPLTETKIKVTREGSTKDDTTYTILPLLNAKDKLNDKQLEKIAAIQLHDLEPVKPLKATERLKNHAPGAEDDGGSDIPF
jgi:hypothetical protein